MSTPQTEANNDERPTGLALATGSERPFKFGDAVQARRTGGEWLDGFFFIAHVPELDCPYIVKGDLSGAGCCYPLRAHNEVRHASPNDRDQPTRASAEKGTQ